VGSYWLLCAKAGLTAPKSDFASTLNGGLMPDI